MIPGENNRKEIIILGAGFAGIYAYLRLHARFHGLDRVRITLVSEHDYFLFLTLLEEVATGNLLPESIIFPVRTLPSCCLYRFVEGRAVKVSPDAKTVTIEKTFHDGLAEDTAKKISLPYDYLISCVGSETNFFGVPGAAEFSLPLKNIADAKRIKNRILDCFEEAAALHDDALIRNEIRFAVVGGGPTGVELAGELADYIARELYRVYPVLRDKAAVVLVHGGERLVQQMEPWFDQEIETFFKRRGVVTIRRNAHVEEVRKREIIIDGKALPCAAVCWGAGVKARELSFEAAERIEYDVTTGRIKVNNYLQLPAYGSVFIAGDQAWIFDKEHSVPYPMRAQFAVREGMIAAENIVRIETGRPLVEFEWQDQGFILSLGKWGALASVLGMHLSGPPAWVLHRLVYLSKIVGIRAKMRTALEWTLNLFTARDITRL